MNDPTLDSTTGASAGTTPEGLEITRRTLLLSSSGVIAGATLASGNSPAQAAASVNELGNTRVPLSLVVNGRRETVQIDPRQSLLDVLRETLMLSGTKKGCNQGACGACTVLLDGRRVNACLTLAVMHDGARLDTIEGLAQGEQLHPLQAAFIEHEGFQCGYCTAGQIMSGVGCIAEGHAGSPQEVRAWMSGNICRCGAYPGVVSAIIEVAGRKSA
jgi:xanthine dehydrogenase YagT iron-sulfur-binding subunit